jgi:hypothetical protein
VIVTVWDATGLTVALAVGLVGAPPDELLPHAAIAAVPATVARTMTLRRMITKRTLPTGST